MITLLNGHHRHHCTTTQKSRQKKERTTFFLSEEKDDVLHPRHDKMAPRTKLVAKVPLAKKSLQKV